MRTLTVSNEIRLSLLRTMFRIRLFDEKVSELVTAGEVGNYHSCFGQEAVPAGICANLRQDDMITSTHRGYGHCIAKGVDMRRLMAEFYGKQTGLSRGKGGEMHFYDLKSGLLGEYPIVGAGIPIAVGAALAAKQKSDKVVVAFFGDGATNASVFHESLNMASVLKVPVAFVCENNGWAENTRTEESMNIKDIASRAVAYGIPGKTIDGNDPDAVYVAARALIDEVREKKTPLLVEAKTVRLTPHATRLKDRRKFEELLELRKKEDPLANYVKKLVQEGSLTEDKIVLMKNQIMAEVDEAVKFARESPLPDPGEATIGVYS
jgi:pyruvate dehydrogenase E1 component alpha subunit